MAAVDNGVRVQRTQASRERKKQAHAAPAITAAAWACDPALGQRLYAYFIVEASVGSTVNELPTASSSGLSPAPSKGPSTPWVRCWLLISS